MNYAPTGQHVIYRAGATWLGRHWSALVLALLVGWYGWATLPRLGDFPLVSWDEGMIAAPAYKLATQGIYGNDLYTGNYGSEVHNYEYMPVYPLLLALTFKLFGLGVLQARLTAVLCGMGALLLTFALGRRLYGPATGLLAAALLAGIRLRLAPDLSGVVLLDIARVARYEPLVLCLALAACCCLLWAESRSEPGMGGWRYAATGLLAGLATLTHPNGGLILPVLLGALVWQHGVGALRRAPFALILGGWVLALLPWLAYIAQHPQDYYGQMLRQSALGRFDLANPAFYWNNLRREPYRYADLLRGPDGLVLLPRWGLWLMAGCALAAYVLLWRKRAALRLGDRLLLLAPPIVAGGLGLLISVKWYHYMALLLPFGALLAAYGFVGLWRWAGWHTRPARILPGALLALALIEGGLAIERSLERARATTPYTDLMAPIVHAVPAGAPILIYHSYWFGLAHSTSRSILLPFYLSSPYYRPGAPPMTETLEQLQIAYILADSHVEPEIVAPPSPGMEPLVATQQQDFMRYIRRYCADAVVRIADPDYGNLTLYRCDASPSPPAPLPRGERGEDYSPSPLVGEGVGGWGELPTEQQPTLEKRGPG